MQHSMRGSGTRPRPLSCIHAKARRLRRLPLLPAGWTVNVASCRNVNVASPTTAWSRRSFPACASQSDTVSQTTNSTDSVLKLSEQLWWIPIPIAAMFGLEMLKKLAGADVVAKVTHPDFIWNASVGATLAVALATCCAILNNNRQRSCLEVLHSPVFREGALYCAAMGAYLGAFVTRIELMTPFWMALLGTGGCYVLLFILMGHILCFKETVVKHFTRVLPNRHQNAVASLTAHDVDNTYDNTALVEFDQLLAKRQ